MGQSHAEVMLDSWTTANTVNMGTGALYLYWAIDFRDVGTCEWKDADLEEPIAIIPSDLYSSRPSRLR